MKWSDESLGMGSDITRRDFVNGVCVTTAGAMLLPSWGVAQEMAASGGPNETYPPRKMGMRGSHPGSFEEAHQLRDSPGESLNNATPTNEMYDLIVVGAGMSGLSSAYFYVKNAGRDAKVLILDNHDDFGGHAKRNEVMVGDKMVVTQGGTDDLEAPSYYSQYAKDMLKDIGIDLVRYVKNNEANKTFYQSTGLRSAYFFDKETWGKDVFVVHEPVPRGQVSFTREFLDKTPLSEQAKKDMLRLLDEKNAPDYFPELSPDDKLVKLAKMTYQDYLLNVVKVDKQVLWFYQHFGEGQFCVGADQTPALFGWNMGMPGFGGLKLPPTPEGVLDELPGRQHGRQKENEKREERIHFPDGNATVARMLVRWLIPDAVPGTTMESIGTAHVNYPLLDREGQPVRIRVSSTVLYVRNEGERNRETGVSLTYSKGGKLYQVRGKACVMASWNMMIPYMIPDLPQAQKTALSYAVKGPLVSSCIAVKNWTAFKTAGVSSISTPTMYHTSISLSQAVSMGDLEHAAAPDDPIFVRMGKIMNVPGYPRKDQHRMGRAELLNITFETFERNIREQLMRVLGPSGFDASRDIIAIAVNRWPHGYAYTYSGLHEPLEWVYTASESRPCVIARQPFGLISIANSDAGASPHTDTAIWEGHRAVDEILNRRAMPYLA